MPTRYLGQEKRVEAKKEPIDVACALCATRFRLWVPLNLLAEWEKGAKISCVRCGAGHIIKKGKEGFIATTERETVERPSPQQEPPHAHAQPEVLRSDAPAKTDERDTVLLIEDDRLSREMAEDTMKGTDVRFVAVKNSSEALMAIHNTNIKLIVTDLYLRQPGDSESLVDGEELLKRVAALNIPALITTGKDIIDDIVLDPKWYDLHVKGFIQKGNPFWTEELKSKIKEVLNKN
jgi:CheY-like chemotaxis protein